MNTAAQLEIRNLQILLRYGYGLIPIAAGADKFLNLLTDWSGYVPSGVAGMLPFAPATFMMVVGVIEIVAGILVLARPQIGAYVVSAWLTLIALVLLLGGSHLDVAVRDLVMALGAYALARLSGITRGSARTA